MWRRGPEIKNACSARDCQAVNIARQLKKCKAKQNRDADNAFEVDNDCDNVDTVQCLKQNSAMHPLPAQL